jgi:hypothetical protein
VPRRELHGRRANERNQLQRDGADLPGSRDEGVRTLRMRRNGVQDELHCQHGLLDGQLV